MLISFKLLTKIFKFEELISFFLKQLLKTISFLTLASKSSSIYKNNTHSNHILFDKCIKIEGKLKSYLYVPCSNVASKQGRKAFRVASSSHSNLFHHSSSPLITHLCCLALLELSGSFFSFGQLPTTILSR